MEHKGMRHLIKDLPNIKLNAGIRLQPWQKLEVVFLLACREKFGFALLADEMGGREGYSSTLDAVTLIV
jgi:hypothetical protein